MSSRTPCREKREHRFSQPKITANTVTRKRRQRQIQMRTPANLHTSQIAPVEITTLWFSMHLYPFSVVWTSVSLWLSLFFNCSGHFPRIWTISCVKFWFWNFPLDACALDVDIFSHRIRRWIVKLWIKMLRLGSPFLWIIENNHINEKPSNVIY